MSDANCIVVKWGDKYPAAEVNRLFAGVARMTKRDVRFLCLTDDPEGLAPDIEPLALRDTPLQSRIRAAQGRLRRAGGALRKTAVFEPGLVPDLEGRLLCLDIDVLVTGPLDDLFDHAPGKVVMPPPFKARSHIETRGEGSAILFDPGRHGFLHDDIARNTEEMLDFSMGSEQRYTSFTAERHGALAHFPPDWVVSFTRHAMPPRPLNLVLPPRLPPGARILCFPSHPKADEAVSGWRAGLRSSRPAPWIADYL